MGTPVLGLARSEPKTPQCQLASPAVAFELEIVEVRRARPPAALAGMGRIFFVGAAFFVAFFAAAGFVAFFAIVFLGFVIVILGAFCAFFATVFFGFVTRWLSPPCFSAAAVAFELETVDKRRARPPVAAFAGMGRKRECD